MARKGAKDRDEEEEQPPQCFPSKKRKMSSLRAGTMTEKRRRTSDHRVGSTQFHQQNKRGKKQQEHEAFSQNDEKKF